MKKFKRAILIVAPLVLILVAPAGAQTLTPVTFTAVYPLDGYCDSECATVLVDGDYEIACGCWDITLCVDEPINFAKVEVLTNWPDGFQLWPIVDGEPVLEHRRTFTMGPDGVKHWYTANALGVAKCIQYQRIGVSSWDFASTYEIRAYTGDSSMDVFQGDIWMVQSKVSQVLGSPIVSNFIYAVLALIVGTWGFSMIIKGLFGVTGVGHFQAGSGMTHGGSGLAHPPEVGDVD